MKFILDIFPLTKELIIHKEIVKRGKEGGVREGVNIERGERAGGECLSILGGVGLIFSYLNFCFHK